MDDPNWSVYALPLIETQCEAGLLRQKDRWALNGQGLLKPPEEIAHALNCPDNLCGEHGHCNGAGECICDPDFTGPSCKGKSGLIK